jgi:hypothetical protein
MLLSGSVIWPIADSLRRLGAVQVEVVRFAEVPRIPSPCQTSGGPTNVVGSLIQKSAILLKVFRLRQGLSHLEKIMISLGALRFAWASSQFNFRVNICRFNISVIRALTRLVRSKLLRGGSVSLTARIGNVSATSIRKPTGPMTRVVARWERVISLPR